MKLVPDRVRQELAGLSAKGDTQELIARNQAKRDILSQTIAHHSGPQKPDQRPLDTAYVVRADNSALPRLRR